MSSKNIIIGIVVVVVLGIGGYFFYNTMNTPSSTPNDTPTGTGAQDQVQAQEIAVGTGAEAKPGDTVAVLYVGQLQDGTVFDSSAAHNNEPLTFVLGADGVIPGFQIGVNGMKEGGERLLAIPASLGYGAQEIKDGSGKVIIPANSTLIFDVKLIKVTPGAESASQ